MAKKETEPKQDSKPESLFSGSLIVVGSDYLGHLFGITGRAVRKWPEMGCPKLARGRFDLKAVFDWWWQNIAQDRAAAGAGEDSINEAKRLYWWEKAHGEQTKNKRESEQLIPREEIAVEWAARMAEVANGLQSLSMRLPPLISGKEQREVRNIVALNVRQILENYSRKGKFCYPEEKKKTVKKSTKKAKNVSKSKNP